MDSGYTERTIGTVGASAEVNGFPTGTQEKLLRCVSKVFKNYSQEGQQFWVTGGEEVGGKLYQFGGL